MTSQDVTTHDLVISEGDEESWGRCSCGVPLGPPLRPDQSFDVFGERWQQHVRSLPL